MSGNPLVAQGFLNRVKGKMTVTDLPALNVTAAYLAKGGISVAPISGSNTALPQMAGVVNSPEVYQQVKVTIRILKTQSLINAYQSQLASTSQLGEIVVTPDSTVMGDVTILNAAIANFGEFDTSGENAAYSIEIDGYIVINNSLWNV